MKKMSFSLSVAAVWCCFFLLHNLIFVPVDAATTTSNVLPPTTNIGGYRVTYYNDTTDPHPGHWAEWDATVVENGNISTVSPFDDSTVQQPLDMCMPFFSRANVQPHINSNGFLSLNTYRLCESYCAGYNMGESSPPGEWPVIGLFIYDLNPSYESGSISKGNVYFHYNSSRPGLSADEHVAIVQFDDVPQYFGQADEPNFINDTPLKAQAELYPNGTIIFRYKSVLSFYRPNAQLPSIGLMLTRNQRVVLPLRPTPSQAAAVYMTEISVNGVVQRRQPSAHAIRFDPFVDECASYSTCNDCYNISGCSWCQSVGQCMRSATALDVCRGTDLLSGPNVTCGSTQPTQTQSFYRTSFLGIQPTVVNGSNRPSTPQVFTNLDDVSLLNTRMPGIGTPTAVVNATPREVANDNSRFKVRLGLPFLFPFFEFPSTASVNYTTRNFTIDNKGELSFTEDQDTNDRVTLVPFSSGGVGFSFLDDVRIKTLHLPQRAPSSDGTFCNADVPSMVDTATNQCPQALVVQINGSSIALSSGQLRFTFQILLQANGFIAVNLLDDGLSVAKLTPSAATRGTCPGYQAYPDTFARFLRTTLSHSRLSASSIVVPWTMHSKGSAVVMAPVLSCPSCSGNGACNPATNQCVCHAGTSGARCDLCAPGFYGPSCSKCPICQNGGVCDDGLKGTGRCSCSDPYSGDVCEVLCKATDPRPLNCPGCNLLGASCLCGRCNCSSEFGWSGPKCDVWTDPCTRYSLPGCDVCTETHSFGPKCDYCLIDNLCYSRITQGGIPSNLSMLHNCPQPNSNACPLWKYPSATSSELNTLLVVVAFMLLVTLAAIGVLALCCCRRKEVNPMVANAVVGMADFQRPRRERELMQIQIVDKKRQGPIQGIPLKQVPLRTLYEFQQEVKNGGSPATVAHNQAEAEAATTPSMEEEELQPTAAATAAVPPNRNVQQHHLKEE